MTTTVASLIARVVCDRLVVVAGDCSDAVVSNLCAAGARDVLHLTRRRHSGSVAHYAPYKSSARIGANNCSVALLLGGAAFALRSRRFFQSFEFILIPCAQALMAGGPGLLRYMLRKQLTFEGTARLDGCVLPLLVFRNQLYESRPRTRIYGPDRWGAKKIAEEMANLDALALRWIEDIEDGKHLGDLDLLASAVAADEIERLLSQEAGIFPIDLYSDDGSGRRTFKSVSYFPPTMARDILKSAVTRPAGIKAPSDDWRYVSYAFHLLFHKSAQLLPGTETIGENSFGKSVYVRELHRLAERAGCLPPQTVTDIETLLRERDVFPEYDTIGFFSEGNAFLAARYRCESQRLGPGLGVFLIRDFALGDEFVDEVRDEIIAKGFTVLFETPVDPQEDSDVVRRIRGGNWLDDAVKRGIALPIHAFVCLDRKPVSPSASERRRYPRLDNARMLLKSDIRHNIATRTGVRKLNAVHASDNSTEADDYAAVLRCADLPAVREAIERLRN